MTKLAAAWSRFCAPMRMAQFGQERTVGYLPESSKARRTFILTGNPMTPCYRATVVVTGLSTNKGAFREEIQSSIRRKPGDQRTHDDLRKELVQGARDYLFEHEARPWQPEARYEGITDLTIEVGEIREVGSF